MAPQTVLVQYEGGSVSEVDVPEVGTLAREMYDDAVAAGRYVIIDGDGLPVTIEPVDPSAYPADGNIGAVISWVRGASDEDDPAEGWHVRAHEALTLELDREEARAGVLKVLKPLTDQDD